MGQVIAIAAGVTAVAAFLASSGKAKKRSIKDPRFKRTKIDLLGIDMLTINGDAAIQQVVASGDIKRVNEVSPTLTEVPWQVRIFISVARFYYGPSGFFLPFRSKDQPSFAPSRAHLDRMFASGSHDITKYVKDAVRVLREQPESETSNRLLTQAMGNALACRFLEGNEDVPGHVYESASAQCIDVADSLKPWRRSASRKGVDEVCTYFQQHLSKSGGQDDTLPKEFLIDVSHICFAGDLHFAPSLRQLAKDPTQNVEEMMAQLARVPTVPRMVSKTTTFGGLLPEGEPAIAKKTFILLNVGDAAKETNNVLYAFGQGTNDRLCAAKPTIIEFLKNVQEELK